MQRIHFDIIAYQLKLISWFKIYGRHALPWQGDFNPYHVWISEVMLQQTQVKTVIPYFLKFIRSFRTIGTLAQAKQDTVMHHWVGLGYYARARNLHKTAQIVLNSYGGNIPNEVSLLMSLPGIGRSTAHAILSIAFNQPMPILDGNVKRVFSRLFLIKSPFLAEKILWELAKKLMPLLNTQAYTQAQMDLGANVCTRSRPKCQICPINSFCLAYHQDQVSHYPVKRATLTKQKRISTYYLYSYYDQIFLLKNPNHGIWGGLYVLPDKKLGFGELSGVLCEKQKHIFTHFELIYTIKVYVVQDLPIQTVTGTWLDKKLVNQYALPTPLKHQLQKFSQIKQYF